MVCFLESEQLNVLLNFVLLMIGMADMNMICELEITML